MQKSTPLFVICTENLVAGQTSLIKVSVANKGSTSQSYEVTATTVPSGILSQSLHPISVGSNGNQEINLHLTAPNISIAYVKQNSYVFIFYF